MDINPWSTSRGERKEVLCCLSRMAECAVRSVGGTVPEKVEKVEVESHWSGIRGKYQCDVGCVGVGCESERHEVFFFARGRGACVQVVTYDLRVGGGEHLRGWMGWWNESESRLERYLTRENDYEFTYSALRVAFKKRLGGEVTTFEEDRLLDVFRGWK